MPRASRRQVDNAIRIELDDNFAFLISSLSSSSDIRKFFEIFLTDEEKTMLAKRLMLHLMLENGYGLAEASAILCMSNETVYKHKRIYNTGSKAYKNIIEKIARRDKTKRFWREVNKLLRPLDLALRAKSDMKARAELLQGGSD